MDGSKSRQGVLTGNYVNVKRRLIFFQKKQRTPNILFIFNHKKGGRRCPFFTSVSGCKVSASNKSVLKSSGQLCAGLFFLIRVSFQ